MKASSKPRRNNNIVNLVLEEVIGLTTKNSNGLASNTRTSYCVYPAGSVAVVYDAVSCNKSHLIVKHRAPKPLSCVSVSPDGKYVAAGELGTQPAVLVWDYAGRTCIAELKSHHYGVSCIAFSPDGQHLASVGLPRDDSICLWHWRSKILQFRIKACSPHSAILSISFSSNGKFIATAGNEHLSLWNIRHSSQGHSKAKTVPLDLPRKPITLNLDSTIGLAFMSVICAHGSIYAITNTGSLFLLQSNLSVAEVVNLMVEKGFALAASSKLIACACSGGIVKLFNLTDLSHVGNLYYSETTNCQNERNSVGSERTADKNCHPVPTHPDAVACQFVNIQKLVVIYSDHSLYVWDIDDKYNATRSCVLVSHADCIMDIKSLPCEHMHDPSTACVARGCSGGVSFASCSNDGVIRLWDLVFQPVQLDHAKETHSGNHNINSAGSTCLVSTGIFERDIIGLGTRTQGFRSMVVSSDGKQLAVGDCQGSLYIYDLKTYEYLCLQEAHDAEILSLSFSLPCKIDDLSKEYPRNHYFLASGGRDGMVHIFDANRNFVVVASIDDHSVAVTSVKLLSNGCKIISCSADGSIILRDILVRGSTCQIMPCQRLMASQGIVYDMAADTNLEFAVSVGKDKKIKTFNLSAGKLIQTCKQNGDFGDPIKITMDQSCSYLLCSYTKKSICMYESSSGKMVAEAVGHGQLITGAIFLPDGKRIISADANGCIFVWNIPASLGSRMLQKNREIFGLVSPRKILVLSRLMFSEEDKQENGTDCTRKIVPRTESPVGQGLLNREGNSSFGSSYRFSISRLPRWARSKITSLDDPVPVECVSSSSQTEPKDMSSRVSNDASYGTENSNQHDCDPSTSGISSDSEDGNDSSITDKRHNFSTGKGTQWNTIYNVCIDHLSTPDIWGSIDKKIPVKRFNDKLMALSDGEEKQIPLGSSTAISHLYQSSQHDTDDIHAGQHVDRDDNNSSISTSSLNEDYAGHHIGRARSSEEQPLEVGKEDPLVVLCDDDDVFNQHFGNLSSNFKLKGKRSSVKRCYSARFVVKRDNFREFMKLTDDHGIGTFDGVERTSSKVVPLNLEDNEAM